VFVALWRYRVGGPQRRRFEAEHGADYRALDARCEALASGELDLGPFTLVTG
jgi:hypothetical protein